MKVAICKFSFVLDLSRLLLMLNKWIMKNGTSEEKKRVSESKNNRENGKTFMSGCETEMRKLCANTLTKQQPFRLACQARKKRCQKEIRKQHRTPKSMDEWQRKKACKSTEQKERKKEKEMAEKSCWTAVRWNKLSPYQPPVYSCSFFFDYISSTLFKIRCDIWYTRTLGIPRQTARDEAMNVLEKKGKLRRKTYRERAGNVADVDRW